MATHVLKFGGSNFRTIKNYKLIHSVLKNYPRPTAVVVSAFYGITDQLQQLVRQPDETQANELLNTLTDISRRLQRTLPEGDSDLFTPAQQAIKQLGRLLKSSRLPQEPYQQTLALSYGERINAMWVVAYLQAQGIQAIYSPPENIGLRCASGPWFASIDFEASTLHPDAFRQEAVYVIPGFYATDAQQRICLLGRGGSDYAAASVTALIQASTLDLWKDVNGFCTANPTLVEDTRPIPTLNYAEAAELAYFGSELLHPRSTEPLQPAQIPIRLFNIREPGQKKPGTIIQKTKAHSPQIIKSIARSDNFAILELQGSGVGMLPGLLAQVTGTLQEEAINIKSVITAQTDINLLLASEDAEKAAELLRELEVPGIVNINLQTDIAVVATVGEGLAATHGVAAKVLNALATRKINIRLMAIGASKVAGYFIISQEKQREAVETIHDALFKKPVVTE